MTLAVAIAFLSINVATPAAQTQAHWFEYFSVHTMHDRFAALISRRLPEVIGERAQFSSLQALLAVLKDANRVPSDDVVFVATDTNTIRLLALRPDDWASINRLKLQLIAPRIWGKSIHIFAHRPFSTANGVKPYVFGADAFIARFILAHAGIDLPPAVTPVPVLEPARLWNVFNTEAEAIVIIVDEDPSPALTQFVAHASSDLQMLPSNAKPTGITHDGGFVASLVPYNTQDFYPQLRGTDRIRQPGSVLVSSLATSAVDGPLPILLTNAESTKEFANLERLLGGSLTRAVSEAYLLALYEFSQRRCGDDQRLSEQQFKTVLLNAYLSDTKNPYTLLGLLGHLMFESYRDAEEKSRLELFQSIARDTHKFDAYNSSKTIQWLIDNPVRPHQRNLQLDRSLRQRFAGHVDEHQYDAAKSESLIEEHALLKEASTDLNVSQRCEKLTTIRSRLATLASLTVPVGCPKPQPQRGLWSITDFEPYYYLAVVDAIMEQSSCPAPKSQR